MKRIIEACRDRNIKTVTLYAFSTENWKRPQKEVDAIMKLLSSYLDSAYEDRVKNATYVRFIGDMAPLSDDIRARIQQLEEATKQYERVLNIAVNYGGRQEIVHAVNQALAEGKTTVSEADISAALYTAPCKEPDLIVRTGGEFRTSNFLLWQSAYAEYAFTKTAWPVFGTRELDAILSDFFKRHRRYGGL
jgi:undecaprenyl diphosphate synthase